MGRALTLMSPSASASAAVDCENGGRLSSLIVHGRELLVVGAASPLDWGLYPMVPFAGRVRNSLLTFEDRAAQLPANAGPHAIHGYGFIREWETVDDTSISFEFGEPWPWRGKATQTFALSDEQLGLSLRVDAVDRQPMQIGWHPWFRRDIGDDHEIDLRFEADLMFQRGDDGIPTGEMVTPSERSWDDCFDGVHDDPVVSWGSVELSLSSTLAQWTVFNQHDDGICVEPQLGPPNAVNDSPHVLNAGESLEAEFTISWS